MATEKTGRTKAEQRAYTRAKLLQVARAEFAAHGYAAAGTNPVVEKAQVTRGALYYHFKDKQALFDAVVADEAARVAAAMAQAADSGDPIRDLIAATDAFLEVYADPDARRILLVDAPVALGWARWREIDAQHVLGALSERVFAVRESDPEQAAVAAQMLEASLIEAVNMIAAANAAMQRVVSRHARAIIADLVRGLAGSEGRAVDAGAAVERPARAPRPAPPSAEPRAAAPAAPTAPAEPAPAAASARPSRPAPTRPEAAPAPTAPSRPSRPVRLAPSGGDRFSRDLAAELSRILEDDEAPPRGPARPPTASPTVWRDEQDRRDVGPESDPPSDAGFEDTSPFRKG